jgi:hypothetical protein
LLSSGKNYTQLGPIDGADPEMGTSYVCWGKLNGILPDDKDNSVSETSCLK